MWSIEAYWSWSGMMPGAKKMIRVILRLFWYDLSYIQYSSKDPCCSLACVKQPIAVPTRHTHFCSSSSSLATFSTCNHYRRLVDTIPRAPRAFSRFQILLSSLFKSCAVVWFTQNNKKFSKSCKGHTVKVQFAAFFFIRKYVSITLRPWNATIASLEDDASYPIVPFMTFQSNCKCSHMTDMKNYTRSRLTVLFIKIV